ncbi:hypothetical protein H2201_006503 [Coniosporium apollinis]|uniref:TNFR-Cys domain-containing protein n=1 Tax=Coniosporium apollinis TaxID=61459 RepID=A0ABQ9NLX5_9PEZI|nr:hypothetical protein H2201_006503 [Coniosporium apollinis]
MARFLLLSLLLFVAAVWAQEGFLFSRTDNDCDKWCHEKYKHNDRECKDMAKHGKGPCYDCGPKKHHNSKYEWCNDKCYDTDKHKDHCNKCNNPCDRNEDCIKGKCECEPGKNRCKRDGRCHNLQKDKDYCGTRLSHTM